MNSGEPTLALVDIGGTRIKFASCSSPGAELSALESIASEAERGGAELAQRVLRHLELRYQSNPFTAVALATAGMVDEAGAIYHAGPTIPNYVGVQWPELIKAKFGVEARVENDVNCAGLAEAVSGAGKEERLVLTLTIGTGVGGSLIMDKQIYRGAAHSAMEIGYMRLNNSIFEQEASATALLQRISRRKGLPVFSLTGETVFAQAQAGDMICREEIAYMVDVLTQGIANLCYALNPNIVVLGGGIMEQGQYVQQLLDQGLDRYLIPIIRQKTKICTAQYGNTAGLIGASYLYL